VPWNSSFIFHLIGIHCHDDCTEGHDENADSRGKDNALVIQDSAASGMAIVLWLVAQARFCFIFHEDHISCPTGHIHAGTDGSINRLVN